jgi:hypothetical protein
MGFQRFLQKFMGKKSFPLPYSSSLDDKSGQPKPAPAERILENQSYGYPAVGLVDP